MNNKTDQWVTDMIKSAAWPLPSPDLHERIMAEIDCASVAQLSVPNFSYARFSLFLVIAFICSFGLGAIQSYKQQKSQASHVSVSVQSVASVDNSEDEDTQDNYYNYRGAGVQLVLALGE